ncbi:C4-dicarboxylate ABC transporter [Marinilactibacillus sp. GCM10026970]|uniref:C4-dicarboxylate ABC transporter n=1 Tax=Marinilactibacillus sp. GCM10026970 TaxID=3252642 RepID=UPI0036117ACA
MSASIGNTIGWTATALSFIGFFIWNIPLGIIAMLLGLAGLMSDQKGVNWTAIGLGAIAVIIGII